MASTNKTTNYELSQYIGSDKPSYLNDYNQDMSKIDLGIHAAKSEADTNATAIGDLTTLTTTAKTDLVSAINEVDSEASTANATAVQADGKADTNATAIGTLANLTTTTKTDLVSAINEVDSDITNTKNDLNTFEEKFNLSDITTFTTGTISSGTLDNCNITVATNSDKSICKIYGHVSRTGGSGATLTLDTNFNVDTEFTVGYSGYVIDVPGYGIAGASKITFKTNGKIELFLGNSTNSLTMFNPFVIFVTDFGDQPNI